MRPVLFFIQYLIVIVLIFFSVSCASYQVVQRESRIFDPSDESGNIYEEKDDQKPCQKLSEGVFIVQAGAFHNISYAQDLRKRLEGEGYASYIILSGFNGEEKLYRVGIGNFLDKKHADEVARDIKNKTNIEAIVALKPPKDKYVVQAGCFTEMTDAQELMKKLKEKGYNAYIKLSRPIGYKNLYYFVLIGEFLDKATAKKLSEEIKSRENLPVFVNII